MIVGWKHRAVVALALLMVGCSRSMTREQIAGEYRVDYGYGIERLTLKSDGTYTQAYADKGQDLREINHGQYELEAGSFLEGQQITLHGPIAVDFGGQKTDMKRQDGYWTMPVRKLWWGEPRILIFEDIGLEFERVKR